MNSLTKNMTALSVLTSVAVWGPASAWAEDASRVGYLDELVVTGTRTEETLFETPVRTEVVTSEELRRTHARNVREALASVPGVQLREVHGKSGYEVWMQGIQARPGPGSGRRPADDRNHRLGGGCQPALDS